jgi:hypothetical protein
MKLLILPMLAALAALFSFTDKASSYQSSRNELSTGLSMPVDTPRIKHFGKIEVKKITGKIRSVDMEKLEVVIINGIRYSASVQLGKFKYATLKADELIVTPPGDDRANSLYGISSAFGVLEFKNATITPLMINAKNKPLFILDGEEQADMKALQGLEPGIIKDIVFLKDSKATSKYGIKAKNGVVEITTEETLTIGTVIQEGITDEKMIAPPIVDEGRAIVEAPASEDPNKIYEMVEIDAEFKGGIALWKKYLEANLDQKVPKKKGAPAGTYTVWAQFIVDKEGKISDIKALSNHGYGMEEEVIRLIKTTNTKWVPAVQNGRQVKSYKKQPVTFIVE